MDMLDWAKREVELACKKENPDWDGESFDYGCSCYQSALKAYETMMEGEHSGLSWNITFNILTRLAKDLPLTPITDEDFVQDLSMPVCDRAWLKEQGLKSNIQCPRMSSLFRKEYIDGRVAYNDVDRTILNDRWGSGLASGIVDELYPITMPYYPSTNKYKVYAKEYKSEDCTSDYDLILFEYLITPNGERVELNRAYYEESGWITREEFDSMWKEEV